MSDALVVRDVKLFKDENELLKKYQDVLVQSILTSFGLDALFFGRSDQVGGTVDTVNNARKGVYSKQYGNEEKYKKHIEAMGDRFNRDAYNKNEDFIEKGREYKIRAEDGTLVDGYTGRPLTSHDTFDREHIISAHEIEKDAGRILAGIEGDILASADSNLTPVDRSINRSKKDKSVKEYIAWLEVNREAHNNELKVLVEKSRQDSLSDKERKRKESLERIRSVDEKLMLQKDKIARRDRDSKINLKYYLGKEFLSQTGKETFKAGWKMGAQQVLGLVFLEVWKALRTEWPHIMETWRSREGWREKLDIRPVLQHVKTVVLNAMAAIKARWKDVLNTAKDGFFAGALSALTTTIVNILVKTGLSFMRMIRNFWSSITGAVRIMRDDSYATRQEKTLAVMRLLSVGVAAVLQPIISECVDACLKSCLPVGALREVLSEFAGAFCSGMISVTLVYFIDNSPIVQKLLTMAGDVVVNAVELVGKGIGLTVEYARKSVEMASTILTSPASYALSMTLNPLMGQARAIRSEMAEQTKLLEVVDGKLDEQTALLHRQDTKLDGLGTTMAAGFKRLDQGIKMTVAIGGQLLDGQQEIKEQLDLLRKEVAKGVQDIRNDMAEFEDRTLAREFSIRLYKLQSSYRKCVEALSVNNMSPPEDDLIGVIEAAEDFTAWLKARTDVLSEGNVKRFPVLSARVMALQLEIDVRRFRAPGCLPCRGECEELLHILRAEIRYHTTGSLFDQLDAGRSFLVEQYVLLQRAMKATLRESGHLQWDVAANDGPLLANPELFAWNDGLDELRQLVTEAGNVQPEAEPVVLLKISSDEERQAYQDYLPVEGDILQLGALKAVFGIPEHVHLNSGMAFGLLNEGRRIKAAHGRALNTELAA